MEPSNNDSWRTRDAAVELLRRVVDPTASETTMSVSSSFDVDTCLARLRRDKAAAVRTAFGAAALTVMRAVQMQQDDDDDDQDMNVVLPPLVTKWNELQDLRVVSMQRAHKNKEVKKIKGNDTTTGRNLKVTSSTGADSSTKKESPKVSVSTSLITSAVAGTADSRATLSRAILCTASSILFDELTPAYEGHEIDVVNVPQNTSLTTEGKPPTVNMGAVLLQAQALGKRAASLAKNAVHRSRMRYQYRLDNSRYQKSPRSIMQLSNSFASKQQDDMDIDDEEDDDMVMSFLPPQLPDGTSVTNEWKSTCLPRFMAILEKGSGHAVYCDVQWPTRHGRIAHLLEQLDTRGPHLIVTTQPEVEAFAQEFQSLGNFFPPSSNDLRVLTYTGSKSQRRKLRQHFASATGLPESPFHVMVTSYSVLLKDYLHLCQMPYQVVLLDDGWSWLAAAHIDSNSSLGTLWDQAIWSSSDQHIGLAGTMHKHWDFMDDNFTADRIKKACIGLTARNRIITASSLYSGQRDARDQGPIPGLVNHVLPQFADLVREEWDRSRIANDAPSMDHMRKLAARSIVVYHPTSGRQNDLYQLAVDGMAGNLPPGDRTQDPEVPEIIEDETFVAESKVSNSRRSALLCFGRTSRSWLRYELGKASFQKIMDYMQGSDAYGHICEEVVTASSLTSSGAGGTVSGSMAYRLAVRCGRSFGSEQGLRQHMAANHAPPGTWLCRTCGSDCGTSQARTHHERACGQPSGGAPGSEQGSNPVGATASVGQGKGGKSNGPVGVVGKKGNAKIAAAGAVGPEDKDSDGSFRVPGYRGVWVNPAGKHFVKIKGKRLTEHEDGEVLLFDTIEEAAKKHDLVAVENGDKGVELNFKKDGSRIVYEETAPAAAAGRGLEVLGGGASNVVPALSVINIKDLPPNVKPLLRDPRQTSRTGGNSKRHVYAYRGVCRQARKGHDRWQSQISFGGTNHYLGTFDSEWDAAAIYAWAHLILYGEEATKQAQREGEEAAAAYEQEKKDIAAGKIIVPPPKPAKKKKGRAKKTDGKKDATAGQADDPDSSAKKPRKKRVAKDKQGADKKAKVDVSSIAPVLAKGTQKVPALAPRKAFEGMIDESMFESVARRIQAARLLRYCVSDANNPPLVTAQLRPFIPVSSFTQQAPSGGALLMGLSPILFGWNVESFLSAQFFDFAHQAEIVDSLSKEYDPDGYNESFKTMLQGTVAVIGRASKATERAWNKLRLGPLPLGGTVGEVDCNIGGCAGSCSEMAATIAYCQSGGSLFQICANNDTDFVTLNGQQIKESMGSFPLFNEDIVTVGARVFVFLLPTGA